MGNNKCSRDAANVAIYLLLFAINAVCLKAQNLGNSEASQAITKELHPSLNQGTNQISVQRVAWTDSRGWKYQTYVFFDHKSHEVVTSESTNQVCYFKGRFYAAGIGIQSFSIISSQPTGIDRLTSERAANIARHGIEEKGARIAKNISLKSVLSPELEKHLAQPLFLRSVQPKIEDGRVAVYFESCTGLKGKTVLDENLDPISTTGGVPFVMD